MTQANDVVGTAGREPMTRDWVLERLREVVARCLPPSPAPGDKDPFNPSCANKSLELICKLLGLFQNGGGQGDGSAADPIEPDDGYTRVIFVRPGQEDAGDPPA